VSVGGLLSLDQVLRIHWSCLTNFGTSIGCSKMERPCRAEIMGSHSFFGLVDPVRGLLGFMSCLKGCLPMGLPMIRPFCKCINK
jgi:hypothetical protein